MLSGEEIVSSTFPMVLGKLDIHRHRNEVGPYIIPLIKMNSQWFKDLNIRTETIKLEENIGKKLLNISLNNDILLDTTTKPQATKAKISKCNYIKLKSF